MKDELQYFLDNISFVTIDDLKRYKFVINRIYNYLPEHIPGKISLRSELYDIYLLLRDMIDVLNGEYEPYYDDEE